MNIFLNITLFIGFCTLLMVRGGNYENKTLVPKVKIIDVPEESRNRWIKAMEKKGEGPSRWSSIGRSSPYFKVSSQNSNISAQILNATRIKIGEIKHQVTVIVNDNWYCSGSLINNNYVLTSGWCCINENFNFLLIAGDVNIYDSQEPCRKEVFVSGCQIHPQFDYDSGDNNLCLIHSQEGFDIKNYNNCIRPTCIPPRNNKSTSYIGRTLTEVGIGQTDSDEDIVWRKAQVEVVQYEICRLYYSSSIFIDPRKHLCASGAKTQSAACYGDDGGPLGYEFTGRLSCQVGVLSFFSSWCNPVAPVVYMRLSYYVDWILSITGDQSVCFCPAR